MLKIVSKGSSFADCLFRETSLWSSQRQWRELMIVTVRFTRFLLVVMSLLLARLYPQPRGDVPFRVETRNVVVDALVVADSQPVPLLTREDFAVKDEGLPMTVELLVPESRPMDLVFLIDVSSSTESAAGQIVATAAQSLSALRSVDRVAVVPFCARAMVRAPLSGDLQRASAAIEQLTWNCDTTHLNASVVGAVDHLVESGRPGAKKAIIMFSDNKGVRKVSDRVTLEALWRGDTILNLILFDAKGRTFSDGANVRPLVAASGGTVVKAPVTVPLLVNLIRSVSQRYTLFYRPPPAQSGTRRRLTVELSGDARRRSPTAKIFARSGYVTP